MINLDFLPEKNGIISGQNNTFEVLLRASSDMHHAQELKNRMPLNLSLVIDRSGSMAGEPLEEAKKCAIMLVERMSARDRLSVVTYDSDVDILFPSTSVLDKASLKYHIDRVRAGGMTALYDGWLAGAKQAALHANKRCLSRILLLSDGQANCGETDEKNISSQCEAMADIGVSTSTYGLSENFNENLMTKMAKSGHGQAHYGQTADDLLDPFQQEFDLMEAIIARRMRLRIVSEIGINFELLNGYSQDQKGRFVLPDLAYGADVWALLRVTINKDDCEAPINSCIKLLTATLDFLDAEGNECRSLPKILGIELLSKNAHEKLSLDETVRQRSLEIRAAALQEQARIAARDQDWPRVDHIMFELDKLGEDNSWIKESIGRLRNYSSARQVEAFSKEANYKSDNMRHRRVSRNEAEFNVFEERSLPSYLRRKLEQGKK